MKIHLIATAIATLAISVAALAADATITFATQNTGAAAAVVKERCCFLLSMRVSAHVNATYPNNAQDSVYGFHEINVDWAGEEIVSYREVRGRPQLAEVFAGGGARIRADVWEKGDWSATNQSIECLVYHSTSPKAFDSNFKDGWMKTESLLEFVQPTGTLDVYAGHLLSHIFGTKCGRGVDHHFENATKAAWGGMNAPYEWTFKGPTRTQWRHATVLTKAIPQSVTPNAPQPGGFYWHAGATSTALVVDLRYFPPRDLATKAAEFAATYPITSHGVKLVLDQE